MPLSAKQSVTVPVGSGLNETLAPKHVNPPDTLLCQDFTVESGGRYTKLEGVATASLPDSELSGSESTILSNRGQLACLTTGGLYAYQPTTDTWVRRQSSSVYPIEAVVDKLAVMGRRAINPDIASNEAGTLCVVWEESAGDIVYSMFLDESGNILAGPSRVNVAIQNQYAPRVVAFDGVFLVAWVDMDPRSTTGTVYTQSYTWSSETYTWGSQQSQGTGINRFDLHAGAVGETHAYLTTSGASLSVRRLPSTGIASHTASFAFAGGSAPVCHDATNAQVYVAYTDGSSDTVLRVYSEDLASVFVTTTLITSASKPSWYSLDRSFIRRWAASRYALVSSNGYPALGSVEPGIYVSAFDLTGTLVDSVEIPDLVLHTRGVYLPLYNRSDRSGCVFGVHTHSAYHRLSSVNRPQYPAAMLAQWSTTDAGTDSRTILCRYAENPSPDAEFDWVPHLNSIVPLSNGRYGHAFTRLVRDDDIITDDGTARIDYVEFDMQALHVPTASAEEATLLGGSHVGFFDRFSAVENSIFTAPEIAVIDNFVLGAGVPPVVAQPALDVTLVARWTDSLGRTHRSPPSQPVTVATSASAELNASIGFDISFVPAITNHNRDNQVDLVYDVYVTDHYDYGTGIGSGYTTVPLGGQRWLRHTIFNASTFRHVTDDNLIEVTVPPFNTPGTHLEQEYVQAGELSSDPTETARDIVASANRVFFLSGTGKYVEYSKPLLSPTYAPEFSDAQRIQVPGEGRSSVALAILDDKLVVFQKDAIYVTSVTGGNNASGSGPGFPQLRPIPTDSGCTNRKSVVTTPVGVLFQGRRGIYMLDRNMRVRFVGGKVERTLTGPVLSAALDAGRSEVVFGYRSGSVDGLIYNYEADTWYTATAWRDGDSMTTINGIWHGLRVGSVVRYRRPDTYTNLVLATGTSSGTRTPVLETSWIKLAGLQGYKRVIRATLLGTHYTGDVRIRVAYNYNDTWVDSFSWLEADIDNPMQLRTPILSRHKVEAVKFEVSEQSSQGSTEGKGFEVEGIELEVVAKPGVSFRQIQNRTGA